MRTIADKSTQHTPGPWRIGDRGTTVFGPPNGEPCPKVIAAGINRADAAFMVLAGNCHDELLEACVRFVENGVCSCVPFSAVIQKGECAHCVARAAIAKVERGGA